MRRFLWTLPLCLILQDARGFREISSSSSGDTFAETREKEAQLPKVTETETLPFLVASAAGLACSPLANGPFLAGFAVFAGSETASQRLAKIVARQVAAVSTQSGFPDCYFWASAHELGTTKIGKEDLYSLGHILVYQPTLFLQMCVDRYDREVRGYTVTFRKRELVNDKLLDSETIKVAFREKPFSVFFDWQEGATQAQRVLYVENENKGMMLARPNGKWLSRTGIWTKDPDGAEAKQGSRYAIKQFGMHQGTQRTVASIRHAEKRGKLFLEYKGVYKVRELNDRPCFKFVRTPYDPLEEPEKILNELIIYIDKEYWLQTGSILRDAKGSIIAEYFFRDLQLNPTYPADQFTEKKL